MKAFIHPFRAAVLAALLACTARPAHAAPGDLDPLDAPVVGLYVSASAVQPDGKTILAGRFTSVLGQPRNNIARLNADGTLDVGFNPDASGIVHSVAVQADGGILLGGNFTTVGGTERNYIARLTADGTLDAGFNPNANSIVYSVAIQGDGSILLGGNFTTVAATARNYIARVDATGALDAGFNPNANSAVYSAAVQADGRILLGGSFTTVGGTARYRIARVDAAGALDAGFSPNVGGGIVFSVALQADGKILLGGNFTSVGFSERNRIARVDATGALDAGFNPNVNGSVGSVAVQADGKILLGGVFNTVGFAVRNRIARVNAAGAVDTGFNPSANGSVESVALQADGRILLGGNFTTVGGTTRNRFARLINDAATQILSATDETQVTWTRGGSSPEISQVTFEKSTDNGATWTPLGSGTRIGSTADWRITGLSLPASGQLRARGRTSGGGYQNGGSGLVEQVASLPLVATPTVASIDPTSGSTLGGTSVTITGTGLTGATAVSFGGTAATTFSVTNATTLTATLPAHAAGVVNVGVTTPGGIGTGTGIFTYVTPPPTVTLSTTELPATAPTMTIRGTSFSSTPGNNSVAFTPAGTGTVTAATATSLTVGNLSGLTLGALNAVVTTKGLSSGAAVQVATVVPPGPGNLDPLEASVFSFVDASATQPDGKMIIAGYFNFVRGQPRNNIARLNADGTLDVGFNPDANSPVHSVTVQADGRILLGGEFTSVGGITRNRIARLNADGTLDADFNPNVNSAVYGMAIQADGGILLGGNFTTVGETARNCIARVNATGALDASFNPNANTNVASVVLQADGRILLGGNFTTIGGTPRNCIARLNADGSLDADFNPGAAGGVNSVAVQADGRILLGGGFTSVGGTARNHIARVNANGTLDADFDPNLNNPVNSVAVQADGRILFGGFFSSVGGTTRNCIARVDAAGTLDAGFNPNVDSQNSAVSSVELQPDGRILLGGYFTSVSGIARNSFARLVNDPATQTLSAPDTAQLTWTRGGSSPEVSQVTFEKSTDNGASWTPLGSGTRIGSTPDWRLTGLSLTGSGQLRARGRTAGGEFNGSSGLVEQVASFSGLLPALETWRQLYFGTTDNTGNAADTFDYDQDGLVNLVEFAFGLDPKLPGSSAQLPQPSLGGYNFAFNFTQPGGVSGITYGAEWSTTLLPGSWTAIPDTGIAPQHDFSLPTTGQPRMYIRLVVTAP
jgi:uncharacterized delta-60 repeat protein